MKKHLLLLLAATASAAEVVTGPPGLDASSYRGTLPIAPLAPLFEQMPLKNRLDMSVKFVNLTGAYQTFTRGTLTLRDASGGVIVAAPLSSAEFATRRTLSSGTTFATGPRQFTFADFEAPTLTSLAWRGANVVAGGWARSTANGAEKFRALRLLLDGNSDTAFYDAAEFDLADGRANAVAIQTDDKVVLAGTFNSDFRVQRLNADGTADRNFGTANGTKTTSLGAAAEAFAMAVDAQGRIVVAGRVQNGFVWQLALVRYMPDGALDATFDGDGIAITDFAGSLSESITALTIDGSGRLVVAGWGNVGGHLQMLVARYKTNGVLDSGFSGDGVMLAPFAGADEVEARSVAVDGTGRIVVGGRAIVSGAQRFALARFTAAGAFDAAFDGDGQVITDFVTTDHEGISGLSIIGGDHIRSAGYARGTEMDYLAVARHDAAGALVPAFAGDGKLKVEIKDDEDVPTIAGASAIVSLPLGDFIIGGTAVINGTSRWVLGRFHDDGSAYTTGTVPPDAEVTLELSDFPFFTDVEEQPFDGFDPKATPARLDVELEFANLAEPLRITGIDLRLFAQNAKAYRYPLHDPSVSGAKWIASGGHERGKPHSHIKAQRFHWDVHAEINGNSNVPGIVPADYQGFWAGHPSGNYDPSRSYKADELPNCQIAWGQPVYAMATGTVVRSYNDKEDNFPSGDKTFGDGAGNSAVIDHGNGEYGVYAHMQKGSVLVTAGQFVAAGTQIGNVGNSGSSSGTHIHFGLVDAPGATSWSDSQSMPMYFIDAKFPTTAGGLPVRQLRAAPRTGEVITIDPSPIPFASPGTVYGPGLVTEIGAAHDSSAAPMRLDPPVSVQGSIGSTPGTAMADGGDIIEDVYRFGSAQAATVWIQLDFPAGHDLDVLLYDATLLPVQPLGGKTLARPETFYASVPAGVYYLCVSRYDPSGNAPASYTLHLGVYPNGRPIYVDWEAACLVPFGNPVCGGGWGGPYPTVKQGHAAAFPGCAIFIRGNHTYPEAIVLRNPAVIRSYNGAARINPP